MRIEARGSAWSSPWGSRDALDLALLELCPHVQFADSDFDKIYSKLGEITARRASRHGSRAGALMAIGMPGRLARWAKANREMVRAPAHARVHYRRGAEHDTRIIGGRIDRVMALVRGQLEQRLAGIAWRRLTNK